MHITKDEEKILQGELGETKRKSMELLVALGDLSDADRLIPISSAQVSGASFKTISRAGVEFLEEFAIDAKVSVKTTLNPIGMDRDTWKELGIPAGFAVMQKRILDAYDKMGIELTCTCTPYFIGNRPNPGDTIAWAESSAVVFANSVLRARTNKEGGPSALAAAIIGKTPRFGLHIDENRRPTVGIRIEKALASSDYTLLGHAIGRKIGQDVPIIVGIDPTEDEHKALGAAMAASGAASMYLHDRDVNACESFETIDDVISIESHDLNESKDSLSTASDDVDIIAVGCPHLSIKEMIDMAQFLKNRHPSNKCKAWFCVSRDVARHCPDEVHVLKKFGNVACDTCMVVAPLEEIAGTTGTDSAKAATYLPTLCKQKVWFANRKNLLELISK
ncbi:MAG: aconitase X catalytic domain-containing protein [Thermoplasmata archaeon]|nr:aconitase X catalytic domain-containing protein [Thermoplasmata archaeon]